MALAPKSRRHLISTPSTSKPFRVSMYAPGAVSLTLKVLHLEGYKPLVEKAFYEAAIV